MLSNMKTLVGLLLVIAGLAYWITRNSSEDDYQPQPLVPSWQNNDAQISAIDKIILTQSEEQLVLTKTADIWNLNDGFYVSIDPLFKLIQSLKSAEIIEAKTANSAKHAQLELADDDLLVNLYQADQLKLAIHIGKKTSSDLTFVRRANEDQTYTVKGLGPISISADNWALKTVLDIAPEDVGTITIKPGEGEMIAIKRNLENGVLQLNAIPDGFQLQANVDLNQLAGGLSRLIIDEAIPAESWSAVSDVTETPAQLSAVYQLNSGAEINLDVYQQDDAYFLIIDSAEYPQYEGWVMKIAEYKFKALNRQLSDFIEPILSEADASEGDDKENEK